MAKDIIPEDGHIVIDVRSDGALTIKSDRVTPTSMLLAAAYLTRTANQMLDSQAFLDAQRNDKRGIETVRAMPDALRQ